MGQYYNIATSKDKNGKITCHSVQVNSHNYTGVKLLEHSYYGNATMEAVCDFLYQNPMYIAWVGDYSSDDDRVAEHLRKTLHQACWGGAPEKAWDEVEPSDNWKFLVNHTNKTYIDLNKHYEISQDDDTWNNGEPICIHPLSLLVSVGNGMGGGGYHDTYVNYDKAGSWAWNKISVEKEAPQSYKEVVCPFVEITDADRKDELAQMTTLDSDVESDSTDDWSKIGQSTYRKDYIDDSWAEACYYVLVQRDDGGDIPLAVDVGSNGRKNLEFMRDNEYSKEYEYAIVQIKASEYFEMGIDLGYDLFDLATDAVRNMGIKNNK